MTYSMWWLWIIFLGVFLLPPIGYGWAYRGWGPPVPGYVQRRRSRNALAGGSTPIDHQAWGWGGDVLWAMVFLWMIWAMATWVFVGGPW